MIWCGWRERERELGMEKEKELAVREGKARNGRLQDFWKREKNGVFEDIF